MPPRTRYIRVVSHERSRGRAATRSRSPDPERRTMTVGCEVQTNLRAENRFSPDDNTRFDDSDDNAAFTEFASRVCNYFDSYYMERHGRGHGMRVKGNQAHGSGNPIALWIIERDGNIQKDHLRQVSMRIESPIMSFDMTQAWRDAVKSMYRSIRDRYLFEGNESCGLHVHLNPSTGWNLKDLRALSKAVVYFEPRLQSLLPLHRARSNVHYKQNYTENPYLSSESTSRCFEIINGTSTIADLEDVMNHDNNPSGAVHTSSYAWDFTNLTWNTEDQRVDGTVVYRGPPQATNARECLAWMELAVTFASAARKGADRGVKIWKKFSRDLDGLREFLEYGAVQWTHRSDYESLFPWRRRLQISYGK